MVRIDIDGTAGNAFAILGMVRSYGRQLSWSNEQIETTQKKMKASGSYEGLVDGFNEAFKGLVELYSQRQEDGEDEFEDEEYLT